jgi:hypothetical protein
MRLPRDVAGNELARKLGGAGYQVTGQTGSQLRLATQERSNTTTPHLGRNLFRRLGSQ